MAAQDQHLGRLHRVVGILEAPPALCLRGAEGRRHGLGQFPVADPGPGDDGPDQGPGRREDVGAIGGRLFGSGGCEEVGLKSRLHGRLPRMVEKNRPPGRRTGMGKGWK